MNLTKSGLLLDVWECCSGFYIELCLALGPAFGIFEIKLGYTPPSINPSIHSSRNLRTYDPPRHLNAYIPIYMNLPACARTCIGHVGY